ncbi:pentapeptide repeat-containing protein [bacterium]|nr:pentapeptide repeat-containing protein [bacterium]
MPEQTCSYEGCTRPVHNEDEGKCIFHCEKKDPQEFRNALAQQIREWRRLKPTAWSFVGFVFVNVSEQNLRTKMKRYGKRLFQNAYFPVWVDFRDAVFLCEGNFYRAKFFEECYFDGTKFCGDAVFTCAHFIGESSFNGIEVSGFAIFQDVKFRDGADFQEAIFHQGAVFDDSQFCKISAFNRARFLDDSSFEYVSFKQWVGFKKGLFVGELNLAYVSFAELGDFRDVIIGGEVRLVWPGEGSKRNTKGEEIERGRLFLKNLRFEKQGDNEEPLLDLRGNALQEDCRLLIHDTNMNRVLLEGTDCRQIEFHNVDWLRIRGRRVMADEYYIRKNPLVFGEDIPTWNEIEETYQQLADRCRKDLKHPAANDFERGIFEARLMAAKEKKDWRSRFNCFLYGIYKLASNFSGSISRPFLWIVLLTVIAAVVYGWLLYDGFSNVTWWPDFSKIWQSLVAAFRVVSLDRGWFSTEVDKLQTSNFIRFVLSFTAIIQTLLTAILITLFIFSVRRRFKHTE